LLNREILAVIAQVDSKLIDLFECDRIDAQRGSS
jgi:hypothetical protein